ncbi:MAG: glycerol-3-phosphate 1-O-acyltransferase PlsY [Alphaproteobacteria bacterium]|nr:glycerol-3-phosphate 1-O-acyltransferase PlsY [Alphaproteobacteria bacterium]
MAGGPAGLALALALGYLLGSIPFGLLFTRAAGLGDIRKIGSGNIGATNVLRTGRKGLAAATLLADALKGIAAVLLGGLIAPEGALAGAAGAFLGHVFPVWLGFRGGKGIAVFLGVTGALAWPAGLIACALWAGTARLTRISSLSALVMAALTPLATLVFGTGEEALTLAGLAILAYWAHRANIARLLAGTEPRIGEKSEPPPPGGAGA